MDFLDFESALLEHIFFNKPIRKNFQLQYPHRLEAYRDGYPARIYEALSEAYPALKQLLENDFLSLALVYAEGVPSCSYDLSQSSKAFSKFLRDFDRTRPYPILSQLAAFEWQLQLCFHKSKNQSLSLEDLILHLKEEGDLALQEHAVCFRSSYAIGRLWKQLMEEESTDLFEAVTCKPSHYKSESFYLIFQDDTGLPAFIDLEPLGYRMVTSLEEGRFNQFCHFLEEEKMTFDISELLQKLVIARVLVAAKPSKEDGLGENFAKPSKKEGLGENFADGFSQEKACEF